MTVTTFASKTGMSQSMLYKLLAGERTPSLKTMLKIERAIGWRTNEQFAAIIAENYALELDERIRN